MKVFLLNICFLAAAFAAPDVSHLPGIQHTEHTHHNILTPYNIPSTNYGVPLVKNYGATVHGSTVHGEAVHGATVHGATVHGEAVHSRSSSPVLIPSYYQPTQHVSHGTEYHSVHHDTYPSHTTHVQYNQHSDVYGKDQHYYGDKVEEEKHVYFYSAPDVTENRPRLKIHIVPQHKKNTNVLYVKVPEYSVPIPEVEAPASHIDEKTKVYVLVKDAKEYAPVVYNAPAPVKTSHPELFVVPYKNEHDVEQVIAGDSHGHTYGSAGLQYDNKDTFVKSINADSTYYHHNDRFSNVHPDVNLDLYRHAPRVPNTFVRFEGAQGHGEEHVVHSPRLGGHHVEAHKVHHVIPHHEHDHVEAHHVVSSSVPSTETGTHSVHTVGGPVVHSLGTPVVHSLGTPVVHSSGVQHNSGVSESSVSVSPLHSIVSSPVPGSSISYSAKSVTPGFSSVSGPTFVSSTVPTVHVN